MHFSLIPSYIILHSCVPTCLSFYYNPFENSLRSASETELLLDEKTIIVVVVVVVVARLRKIIGLFVHRYHLLAIRGVKKLYCRGSCPCCVRGGWLVSY